MKIYQSFRYQLWEQRYAFFVYYAVLVSMILVSLAAMPFVPHEASGFVSTNGATAITAVFAFILSLCAFKESFLINLQHGISRRSQFLARLAVMGTTCAIMAASDEAYTLLVTALHTAFPDSFRSESLYEMVYASHGGPAILPSIVFSFFFLLAVCSLGYLVTVFMYRLHKIGKIIFWAGTPTLFILFSSYLVSSPALEAKVLKFIIEAVRLCYGSLPRMALTCTLLTGLFSILTWLLIRRAAVK